MKQSYIQHIEKTVREHCKELQELSLGCKVRNKEIGFEYDVLYKTWCGWAVLAGNAIEIREDLLEIIGHEIHLEHVLRTMGEDISIDGVGKIWELDRGTRGMEQARWYNNTELFFNLSLSWKDQEEETLKWMAETMGYSPYEVVTHFGMPHVPPLKITPIS